MYWAEVLELQKKIPKQLKCLESEKVVSFTVPVCQRAIQKTE